MNFIIEVVVIDRFHCTIYGAVCFKFTHLPCDDRENFVLLSSLNRKYELLPIV